MPLKSSDENILEKKENLEIHNEIQGLDEVKNENNQINSLYLNNNEQKNDNKNISPLVSNNPLYLEAHNNQNQNF